MTFSITGPHLLRIVFAWAIFYYAFNLMFHTKISSQRKIITYFLLFIASVILNIFLPGFSIIFIALLIYFGIWHQKTSNYYLINIILLNLLIKFLAVIIATPFLIRFFPNPDINSYSFDLTISLTEFVISMACVYFYNLFKLNSFFKSRQSAMTSIILGYVYIILYMTLMLIQHFSTYTVLIAGILLFTLIQSLFIIFIFSQSRRRQRRIYQDKFAEEQVKNLKLYTDQLEHDQLKLRHFKHDYKNLLFSLKTVAHDQNYAAMNQALDDLENYSDGYLNNLSMDLYQDLNNVKNPYLKSLFINKINTINQNGITSYFNCYDELNDVPINIFDLIKLLNQAIDNAIKLTKHQEHGKIQLAITQEDQQLAFLINNTVSNLPTTEREEPYLKLLNIKDLKRKYSNIFIQHSKNDKWFRFHVTLIKNKGE